MANIKMYYMYRDGANYKNHGEVVFTNPSNLSIAEIEARLRQSLIDGDWFNAIRCGVTDLHFEKWDNEIDHDLHEYESIEYTEEMPQSTMSIEDFLNSLS